MMIIIEKKIRYDDDDERCVSLHYSNVNVQEKKITYSTKEGKHTNLSTEQCNQRKKREKEKKRKRRKRQTMYLMENGHSILWL